MAKISSILVNAAAAAATVVALLSSQTNAFYMAGVKPKSFKKGDEVELKVNAITSVHTQIAKHYYSLAFCEPMDGIKRASESLGELLTGNKIMNSPYSINMLTEVYCQRLCQKTLSKRDAKMLSLHIGADYHNNWIIDNLPSASFNSNPKGNKPSHYAGGFSIGFVDRDRPRDHYIFNHVNIILDYHTPDKNLDAHRIVAFYVEPMSIKHSFAGNFDWDGASPDANTKQLSTCPAGEHMRRNNIERSQIVAEGEKIIYTYDVMWQYSEVPWSSRWDVYLSEDGQIPASIHWYSITNSILVVIFLSLLVLSILVRNLRRDIAGYNADLTDEEKEEEANESGWKLIHADVFRPPQNYPMLYCVMVGSGLQISVSTAGSIMFSAIGYINPSRRGSLITAVLVLFMLSGVLAGYASSRLFKTFNGKSWQACTVFTATGFPGVCFALFLFFNTVLSIFHSSAAVPFLDIIIVAAMWCCVSIPLVFIGAFAGYKQHPISFPTVTSGIARAIPPSQPLLNPILGICMTGLVPFAAAYVELFFIMTSLWMDQFYYVFGFTLIVFIILLVTSAEMTVLFVYYQLCAENHRWWWFSFMTGGSVAFYMFMYSIVWFGSLDASRMFVTYLLYFGYMVLLSLALFLVTGMVGSMTSLWFIRKIFSTIKVD